MISVLVCGSVAAAIVLGRASYQRWKTRSTPIVSQVHTAKCGVIRAKVGERVCLRKNRLDDDMIIWSAQYKGRDVSGAIREGMEGFSDWEFVVSDELFDVDELPDMSGDCGELVIDWELMDGVMGFV